MKNSTFCIQTQLRTTIHGVVGAFVNINTLGNIGYFIARSTAAYNASLGTGASLLARIFLLAAMFLVAAILFITAVLAMLDFVTHQVGTDAFVLACIGALKLIGSEKKRASFTKKWLLIPKLYFKWWFIGERNRKRHERGKLFII